MFGWSKTRRRLWTIWWCAFRFGLRFLLRVDGLGCSLAESDDACPYDQARIVPTAEIDLVGTAVSRQQRTSRVWACSSLSVRNVGDAIRRPVFYRLARRSSRG